MAEYSTLAASAARLVAAYGRTVTVRRTSRTPGATPWNPTEAASDYSVSAVAESFAAREVDGTVIRAGDRRYLLAASGLAISPEPDDEILDDGIVWKILSVETVEPGSTAILYRAHVRR